MKLMVVTTLIMSLYLIGNAQEPHVRERARTYEPLIAQAAAKYGVDPHLLWAVAHQETRFQPRLVSPKGARGLMQFMPATAVRYGLSNPYDPHQAIEAAARYLRDLSRRFNGDIKLMLAAYNSGEGTVEAYRAGRRLVLRSGKVINASLQKTDGVPPYRETQNYVKCASSIYNNISRLNVFNGFTKQYKIYQVNDIGPALPEEVTGPERSIYLSALPDNLQTNEATTPAPLDQTITKRDDSVKTSSIYIR